MAIEIKNRGHKERENEHAVLRDLGIGDALHSAHYGVDEDNPHADQDAAADVHIEKSGKNDADATHLAGHVGERYKDGANHRDQARLARVITFSNEIGHGVLPKLSQVRGQ